MNYIREDSAGCCLELNKFLEKCENFWLETIRSFRCYWTLLLIYAMIANGVTNL